MASDRTDAKAKHESRETWLRAAVVALRPVFVAVKSSLPATVHVSCGFPSVRALSKRNRTIGECWQRDASSDGNNHIFISPVIANDDAVRVLDTLVHAVVGNECGHRGAFKQTAVALGLEGPMTATRAGDELRKTLTGIARMLGRYPHATLDPLMRPVKKQTTRMLKLVCSKDGYTARTTKKWIEDMGVPTCPCGREFEVKVKDEDEDGEDE